MKFSGGAGEGVPGFLGAPVKRVMGALVILLGALGGLLGASVKRVMGALVILLGALGGLLGALVKFV